MSTIEKTIAYLGGTKILGANVSSDLALADAVAIGLPSGSLDALLLQLAPAAIPQKDLYQVVGSERTLKRKRVGRTRLSVAESDKLARLARVAARAEEALGDRDRALRWLGKPNRALGGKAPVTLLGSDAGTVVVEQVLERLAHGVVA
jgi:putative toxin-antitoxin system antitoxin component (TIGR02293 family)